MNIIIHNNTCNFQWTGKVLDARKPNRIIITIKIMFIKPLKGHFQVALLRMYSCVEKIKNHAIAKEENKTYRHTGIDLDIQ